jgi:hypothetical protein
MKHKRTLKLFVMLTLAVAGVSLFVSRASADAAGLGYHAQFVGSSAPQAYYSGSQQDVYLDFTNTGTTTWSSSDLQRVRLQTAQPENRTSPLGDNSWNDADRIAGWYGKVVSTIVTPSSTIAPGETARFYFSITIPTVSSNTPYNENFQLYLEGVGPLEDDGALIQVTALPMDFGATLFDTSPTISTPGNANYTFYVDYTNTGTIAWENSGSNPVRLTQYLEGDGYNSGLWKNRTYPGSFSGKRVGNSIIPASTIEPGEVGRFEATIPAGRTAVDPPLNGPFSTSFMVRPMVENVAYIGDTATVNVDVAEPDSPSTFDATWVSSSSPVTGVSGQRSAMYMDYMNTGSAMWYTNEPSHILRLKTAQPSGRTSQIEDPDWVSSSIVGTYIGVVSGGDLTYQSTVSPGQIARFIVPVTIPSVPTQATYDEYFQLNVQDQNIDLLDNSGYISVTALPGFKAQKQAQTGPITLTSRETQTVHIDYTNTGSAPWPDVGSDNPILRTSHALGRNSALADSSWTSQSIVGTFAGKVVNNVVTPVSTINPGETARYSFIIKAPDVETPTNYTEYFQLYADSYGYFTDDNTNLSITVNPLYSSNATSATGQTTLGGGDYATVTADFANTGSVTWRDNGPNQAQLATSAANRVSAFRDQSWMSASKVGTFAGKVVSGNLVASSTVAPGETARFTFIVKAPNVASSQNYNEAFMVSLQGLSDITDGVATIPLTAVPAGYRSQWTGQSSFPSLTSGQSATVYVDFRNSGTMTWRTTGANPINIGTSGPLDRASMVRDATWGGSNRPGSFAGTVSNNVVTPSTTVLPGQVGRFSFTVTAPAVRSQTVYREFFRLVAEGSNWMDDQGVFINVAVNPGTYSYSVAGQSNPPLSVAPGTRSAVTLDLTNTGSATWRAGGATPFYLGTDRPRDRASTFTNNTWRGNNRPGPFAGKVVSGNLSATDTIAPGETARFSFDVVASRAGYFQEYVTPVVETFSWLTDLGIYFPMHVNDNSLYPYDYFLEYATPSPTIRQGQTANMILRLRNIGRSNWTNDGVNPFRLGASSPRDRGSGFGGWSGWLGNGRIVLTSNVSDPAKNIGQNTTVAPGEVGEFQFTFTANPGPGVYPEAFTPVAEGFVWLRDKGLRWIVTVTP